MTPIGFHVDCDNAECADCHNPDDWPGFEYWPEPVPIYPWDPADVPTHCRHCGDVIAHDLTSDGYDYARERLTHGQGGRDVLDQWADTYGHAIGHHHAHLAS